VIAGTVRMDQCQSGINRPTLWYIKTGMEAPVDNACSSLLNATRTVTHGNDLRPQVQQDVGAGSPPASDTGNGAVLFPDQ
jgi:hypothetical protein